MEQLLEVATAKGRLAWAEWKVACSSVSVGDAAGLTPSTAFRLLEMLGHLELGTTGDSVFVCAAPGVLARLPVAGLPQAVYCGGRAPHTEDRLREAAQASGVVMTRRDPSKDRAPSVAAYHFSANEPAALASLAGRANLKYSANPAAWRLAHASGSLDGYIERLTWAHGAEPAIPAVELQCSSGRFIRPAAGSGMRLLKYTPSKFRPYFEIRHGERSAKAHLDWGFWACARDASARHLVHDREGRAIAVPAAIGLPRPLARALALCTGRAPVLLPHAESSWSTSSEGGYHVFTGIGGTIAETVLTRLGQNVIHSRIESAPAP